jgi:prolyl-tRNA synthetase
VINSYFTKWIQSYRDLPMLINQWANVVRWELRPRLFLRTSEFLWQEGHTAHATEADARAYAVRILREVYEDFMVNVLAIPILTGIKTPGERFAGATNTFTCEAMMGDGKALQMGTSHELGQNFARAFGTTYLDDAGEQVHVWQTSWGTSTRMVGGLIMTHGDDQGLRIPPVLAAVQAVVLLVRDTDGAGDAARQLASELAAAGVRVELDDQVATSFGRRATDWELKGLPVRVEVGPRDLKEGLVTLVRRDSGEKAAVPLAEAATRVVAALDAAQGALLAEARDRRESRTAEVGTVADALEASATGFARIPWATIEGEGEAELARSAVTVRCLQRADGSLPESPEEADLVATVGRAY